MVKGKKSSEKTTASKDPKDAIGWLKKAYIDNDPSDGAPSREYRVCLRNQLLVIGDTGVLIYT